MKHTIKEAIRLSFPVMVGYVFLGIAFGILCQKQGYSMIWAFLISTIVYAGSMQFILLTFFHSGFSLIEVALVTLTVNARQLFYGLSYLKQFQAMGKRKWYMIFALTDETYSLLCAVPNQEGEHGKQLMFFVSLFNQLYWVIGSVLGATLGSMITFNTAGIDFAMTALFTVIFVEQWLATENHKPVYIACIAIILAIMIFHLVNFLLPALIILVVLLMITKNKVEEREDIT